MNILRPIRSHNSERGSAVLVLLAFLPLIALLSAATTRSVLNTRKEVELIEKRQLARLAANTNHVVLSNPAASQ